MEREPAFRQCSSYKTKMEFLARSLTLFFGEADIETHTCRMLDKKFWMKDFKSYEEQMEWILMNFINYEERQQYQKELALENILSNARGNENTCEIICNGSYKYSNYIIKLVFCITKEE